MKPEENDFVRFLRDSLPEAHTKQIEESAALSFCHPNPLIRQFVWQRVRRALEMTEGIPCTRILDFGSGSGVLLPFCAPKSVITYALDINPLLAERTKKEYGLGNVEVIRCSRSSIPLDAEAVDLVYALEVFEHVQNLDEILSEIHRVCKLGGHLLFSVPTENILYKMGRFLAGFKGDYHKDFCYKMIMKEVEDRFTCVKYTKLFKLAPAYVFGLCRKEA